MPAGKEVQPECISQRASSGRLNCSCSRSRDLTAINPVVPEMMKIAALAVSTAPGGNMSFAFSKSVPIAPAKGRGKRTPAWTNRRAKALVPCGFADAKTAKGILQYQNSRKRLSNCPRRPREEVRKNGSFQSGAKYGIYRYEQPPLANIGQIPQFEKLIATIRSREISASIILQSQSQLKAIYKDAAEIILDNADSTLFLGGRGKNAKDISENLGRETIDSFNTSENRGTQVSHGLNYQKLGKELMTQDEIAVMDGGKCILQLRGVRPFFSDKYDITQHPNYKYLSDFDKKNAFDVERYMSTRPAIVKPDEPFDIYEIDLSDEDAAAE